MELRGRDADRAAQLAMGCDQCNFAVAGRVSCDNCVVEIQVNIGRLRINGGDAGRGGGRAPVVPRRLPAPEPERSNKRALLVGIKYRGRRKLDGPINDVMFMKMLLCEKFKFPFDSMLVLTDDNDERESTKWPTRANILRGMRWLVEGCSSGDSLVFHFSGHGDKVTIEETDEEEESYYETICALDGDITDDEINKTIVRPLVQGVKLHAIVDSCHSDTVLDLTNICRIKRSGRHEWEDGFGRRNPRGGRATMISGGNDRQNAAEYGSYGGLVMGALTTAFFAAAMTEPRPLTYGRRLTVVRANIYNISRGRCTLPDRVSKVNNYSGVLVPQLSSSYQFDIDGRNFTL